MYAYTFLYKHTSRTRLIIVYHKRGDRPSQSRLHRKITIFCRLFTESACKFSSRQHSHTRPQTHARLTKANLSNEEPERSQNGTFSAAITPHVPCRVPTHTQSAEQDTRCQTRDAGMWPRPTNQIYNLLSYLPCHCVGFSKRKQI